MKKNLKMLAIAALLLTLTVTSQVNAMSCDELTEEEFNYIAEQTNPKYLDLTCSNGTPYTDEYLAEIGNVSDVSEKTSRIIYNDLYMPNFKQEKNNWCGPASLKQVIHYYNKSSLSQQQYANDTETDTYGSAYVFRMANTLNKYLPSKNFIYELGSSINNNFIYYVYASIDSGNPIILHARTKSLELYNGRDIGHYLTVEGYYASEYVNYVDTWSRDYGRGDVYGHHGDTLANVQATVTASGRYVIYDKTAVKG